MIYKIAFTKKAVEDLEFHKKVGDKAVLKKISNLIKALEVHPKTGIGKPEQLKHNFSGQWSREITNKHRMVYRILETEVIVEVLQAKDHYNDK